MVDTAGSTDSIYEQLLLSIPECFVYKIPPLRSSSGFFANAWDLANPLATCIMKIFRSSDLKLTIRLYLYSAAQKGELVVFGESVINFRETMDIEVFVQTAVDTSRYFSLKIQDPHSQKSMVLGIGFRERETAFDFKGVISEHLRFVQRMQRAEVATLSERVNNEVHGTDRVINPSHDDIINTPHEGSGRVEDSRNSRLALAPGVKLNIGKIKLLNSSRKQQQQHQQDARPSASGYDVGFLVASAVGGGMAAAAAGPGDTAEESAGGRDDIHEEDEIAWGDFEGPAIS